MISIYKKYYSLLLFFTIVLFSTNLSAQDTSTCSFKFDLFPSGSHFQSLKANYQEAKVGVLYFPSNKNLKIDLGNTVDLISMKLNEEKIRITMGIDFFAYALSTSFAGNRLQIDALDGLFGGNAVISKQFDNDCILIRFRILHNSAHLVDGHYDQRTDSWIDNQKPIPYTKDFGELVFAYENNSGFISLRSYAGTSYASLIRPFSLKRWNFLAGIESTLPTLIGKIFNNPANLFASYHFLLNGEIKYSGNSNIMLGLKFGEWKGKGVLFYTEYYSGQRRFNEYYRQSVEEFGVGFYVDF